MVTEPPADRMTLDSLGAAQALGISRRHLLKLAEERERVDEVSR